MIDHKLFTDLERLLIDCGVTFTSCADLSPLPADKRRGLPVGVCLGVGLKPSVVAEIAAGPTRAYAAEYTRANALLERLGDDCAAFLRGRGFHAVSLKPTETVRDNETLSTPLPHKTVATRAGVGWIGKCALLVTGTCGSAVRYNTVLTDAPLPVGTPVESPRCGDCTSCVEACPASAPSGMDWRPGLDRAGFFDAFACRDCASRLALKAGSDRSICGICIAVCPYTREYLKRNGCFSE
ncbi:MAG TPA: epoxyqueuosine reductase [archaeon]|nr:epoxyqueuosine reductase [archaeon]